MAQAVILAGGKGTRLASRLNGEPKPLVDVDGVLLPQIHAKLESELGDAGAFLDAIYHPHRGYAGDVPEPKIDCAWMVGDNMADMAMARKAGIRSVLVETGEGGRDGAWPGEPDVTAGTLVDAVDVILMGHESAGQPAISETMQP